MEQPLIDLDLVNRIADAPSFAATHAPRVFLHGPSWAAPVAEAGWDAVEKAAGRSRPTSMAISCDCSASMRATGWSLGYGTEAPNGFKITEEAYDFMMARHLLHVRAVAGRIVDEINAAAEKAR